jgi:hypothetical protein
MHREMSHPNQRNHNSSIYYARFVKSTFKKNNSTFTLNYHIRMKHPIQYSEYQKRNGYVNSTQGDTTSTTDSESRITTFKRARQSTFDSSI